MPAVMLPIAPANPAVANNAASNAAKSGSANNASSVNSSSNISDDHSTDTSQHFSQLLDDTGSNNQDTPNPPPAPDRSTDTGRTIATSVLAAQEVTSLTVSPTQLITPQQATDLLAKLDVALSQQGGGNDNSLFQQLKSQLQQIQKSGKPQSVAELTAAVDAALNAAQAGTVTASATPVAQRVLSWLQKALAKTSTPSGQESPQDGTEAADNAANATVQSLQATLFRADDGTNSGTAETTPGTKEKSRKYVEAIPLALLTQVTAPTILPVAATDTPLPTAAVSSTTVTNNAIRADLDAAIPPLTLPQEAADDTLPEIDLPGMAQASTDARVANTRATTALNASTDADNAATVSANSDATAAARRNALNITQHLQAAVSTQMQLNSVATVASNTAATSAQKTAVSEAAAVDAAAARAAGTAVDASSNPVLNPSAVGGHSAANSASAVQPTSTTLSPNLVNHAPVTEQVHVAIRQANKEGVERITIQLDPVDLGRVEVSMHKNSEGHTQVSFTVDKPSTFDALSRDARSLERSLQDAGIKADAGNMQFNLRQQPQSHAGLQSGLGGQGQFSQNQPTPEDDDKSTGPIASIGAFTRGYTVNVRDGLDIHA